MNKKQLGLFFVVLLMLSAYSLKLNGLTVKASILDESDSDSIIGNPYVSSYTNVILLGWDGVQRNHLFELLNAGRMPNLTSFIQTGKFVNVTVSDHYTDTKAGWTQILTGYKWWRTAVFSNHHWFHSIPRSYTIPERLEKIYGANQIATAFITGKLNQMEIEDRSGSAAVGSAFSTYSNEAIYDNLPSQLDVVSVGDLAQDRYADVVGPLMLQFIQNNTNNRFFGFFHFSDPDHVGHMFGENSVEYENAIIDCDYWLGQIINKLNTLGLSQNTLIYITADHGMDEGSIWHSNAPYIFLATNDKNVIRNGDEVDIAPTVYFGLGLKDYDFEPDLDGFPLQVALVPSEAQHRQAVLNDTLNLPMPSISIADTGPNQKTVTFSATDNNLAAVFLLLDNSLKTTGPWTWTNAGTVTASGTYNINTDSLSPGFHTVKVFAFDEHGANNGGPGTDPANGGGPSANSVSFNVETQLTPSPSPSLSQSPSLSPSPSPMPSSTEPTQTPSPTIVPTFSALPSESSSSLPSVSPSLSPSGSLSVSASPSVSVLPSSSLSSSPTVSPSVVSDSSVVTYVVLVVVAVVVVAVVVLLFLSKKKN